ncbi:MAG: hypothetical protein J6L85_07180 [Clostridia bacterium]|nr:hypothetical protein [Clostridia bacterium]
MSEKKKRKNPNTDIEDIRADILSSDELKILAATRPELDRSTLPNFDNSDIAIAKRFAKKNKTTVIFVTLTVIILLAVIVLLSVFLINKISNAPSKDDYTVSLGEEEYTVKYKQAMKDGILYLDVYRIAGYADLVISGDKKTIKISCEDGSYVRFWNGKTTAEVNGDTVRLEGAAYINAVEEEDRKIECLVPFSFIEKLFSYQYVPGTVGLVVRKYDQSNSILIRKKIFAETEEPIPIGFNSDCFDVVVQ